MVRFLLIMAAALFCIVGVCESMHALWLRFIKPREAGTTRLIIFTDGQNFTEQFDYYFEKYRWDGDAFADGLIFLYSGEVPKSCKKYENIYPHVRFCEYGKFFELLNDIGENNAGKQ